MALAQTQALLARLFTDDDLRREFFEAPIAVATRFGLSMHDTQRLAGIDSREIEAFAQSLTANARFMRAGRCRSQRARWAINSMRFSGRRSAALRERRQITRTLRRSLHFSIRVSQSANWSRAGSPTSRVSNWPSSTPGVPAGAFFPSV
ncbi:MAG: hypothetical protein CTY36_15710 [Methylocystis sp.]|nr:MAG: hypothetical protein CTY36_15710 [Methylocystis sp.]